MSNAEEHEPARRLQIRFSQEFLRDRDPVKAAVRAGVGEEDATAAAERLMAKASTHQLIEIMSARLAYLYGAEYRNPPPPILDNVFHCCSQKTASQWLKQVFIDPAFYRASGLKMLPYVALGNRYAAIDRRMPVNTIVTHLYVGYETYRDIPKPGAYKTFYVLRDPRDTLVSWYYSIRYSHGPIEPIPRLRQRLNELDRVEGMVFLLDVLEEWAFFECQRSWVVEGESDPHVRIFRYEDLARNEAEFLRTLFDYLGIRLEEEVFQQLCRRHAFERYSGGRRKGNEDQRSHYRSGACGEWRRKLPGIVLDRFAERTGDLVEVLGYPES